MPATPRPIKDVADALIRAAIEADQVPRVVGDVAMVAELFQTHPELLGSLEARSVPEATRMKALRSAFEKTVDPFVINALLTLQRVELLSHLDGFLSQVIAIARALANHYEVSVQSASPLTDAEGVQLRKILEKKFGGTHHICTDVDPRLLGGLIIDVGDWHLDASLKGKLERLKQTLIA